MIPDADRGSDDPVSVHKCYNTGGEEDEAILTDTRDRQKGDEETRCGQVPESLTQHLQTELIIKPTQASVSSRSLSPVLAA